jgi:hypothetical protein
MPSVVVHACNPSTQEDQELEARVGYIVRLCLKKQCTSPLQLQVFLIADISNAAENMSQKILHKFSALISIPTVLLILPENLYLEWKHGEERRIP